MRILYGRSLSFCISDVINGLVQPEEVAIIVAQTRYLTAAAMIRACYRDYWRKADPVELEEMLKSWIDAKRIIEPRILNPAVPINIEDMSQFENRWIELKPGTQIAYMPAHAGEDFSSQAVEFGFIEGVGIGAARCRYWKGKTSQLRTTANSELTYYRHLRVFPIHPQRVVDKSLKYLGCSKEVSNES